MRLVVTGRNAAGRSVFTHDGGPLSAIGFPDGGGFEELWMTAEHGRLADADGRLERAPFYPRGVSRGSAW